MRSSFSVMDMGKLFDIFTKFLDMLEFILARILMNVRNWEVHVIEILKYIREFTLLNNLN